MSFLMRRGIISSSLVGGETTTIQLNAVDQWLAQSTIVFGDIDWWIHYKVRFDVLSPALGYQMVSKQLSASPTEFHVRLNSNNTFSFALKNVNLVTSTITATSITDWYDVYVAMNKTGSTIGISVNNETLVTSAKTQNTPDTASVFQIGTINTANNLLDGSVAGVRAGTGVLTVGQRTELFNSGDMLCYADLSSGITDTVFGAWELAIYTGSTGLPDDDISGNGQDLTAVGSPVYADTGLIVDCS